MQGRPAGEGRPAARGWDARPRGGVWWRGARPRGMGRPAAGAGRGGRPPEGDARPRWRPVAGGSFNKAVDCSTSGLWFCNKSASCRTFSAQVSANPQVSAVLGSKSVATREFVGAESRKLLQPAGLFGGGSETVATCGFVQPEPHVLGQRRVCACCRGGGYFARHAFATKMRGIKRVKECDKRRVCARRGLKSVASVRFAAGIPPAAQQAAVVQGVASVRFAAGIPPVPPTCRTSLGVFARAGLKNFELCVPQNAFWASVRRRCEKLSRKTADSEVAPRASFPGGRRSHH